MWISLVLLALPHAARWSALESIPRDAPPLVYSPELATPRELVDVVAECANATTATAEALVAIGAVWLKTSEADAKWRRARGAASTAPRPSAAATVQVDNLASPAPSRPTAKRVSEPGTECEQDAAGAEQWRERA